MEFWERNVSFHICQLFDNPAWTKGNQYCGEQMGRLLIWGITHYFPSDPELDLPQSFDQRASSRDPGFWVSQEGQSRAGLGKADG